MDAIYTFLQHVYEAWNDTQAFCDIFVDLTKAFDCICHHELVRKLEAYGFRGILLRLVKSYLRDRRQQMFYNNQLSEEVSLSRRIPQGSILGTMLFILAINDLPSFMEENTILFDTTFDVTGANSEEAKLCADQVLKKAETWFSANELLLNKLKTVLLSFTTNPRVPTETVKFLGVTLDSKLKWKEHIGHICNKLSSAIYAIRQIRECAGESAALTAYFTLFHSTMTYGLLA